MSTTPPDEIDKILSSLYEQVTAIAVQAGDLQVSRLANAVAVLIQIVNQGRR